MPSLRGRAAAARFLAAAALAASLPAAAQVLESLVMPGKVIEGHAKLEAQCESCHRRFDKAAQSRLCLDCHKDVAADAASRKGFHGRSTEAAGRECRACHTEHKGREARIAAFDAARFDHGATDFALRGAHAKPGLECAACHAEGRRHREAPAACVECHRKDDAHKGSLGPRCAECHDERSWKETTFDHDRTAFALSGKHAVAKCAACHEKTYKETPKECVACHRKDDAHKGRYGTKCGNCHDARNWENRFAHDTRTKFPLGGRHRLARCESCHKAGIPGEKLPLKCGGCHKGDDVHKGSLGEACERCHDDRAWKAGAFDHARETKFALRHKHREAKCEACHVPGRRGKLATTCVSCHGADDAHAGRYGPKCETCHGEESWLALRFDHDRDTKYRLAGRHRGAKCDGCHRGDLYREKAPRECIGCHRKDDAHRGQQGERCGECHGETDWRQAPFDHARSRFPLLGAHLKVACKSCHRTPLFKDAPGECAACHGKDDVHREALGPKCGECHNARSWLSWDFDHARRTGYALEGGHRKAKCAACHVRPAKERAPTPRACFACHRGEDVHGGAFGTQCERCHVVRDWREVGVRGGVVAPARQPRGGG